MSGQFPKDTIPGFPVGKAFSSTEDGFNSSEDWTVAGGQRTPKEIRIFLRSLKDRNRTKALKLSPADSAFVEDSGDGYLPGVQQSGGIPYGYKPPSGNIVRSIIASKKAKRVYYEK